VSIDWTTFTPWSALAGGAIIGIAAVLFALFNGRVAGISGIVGGLLRPPFPDAAWRVAFLAGLIAAPILYGLFAGPPDLTIDADYSTLVVAGILVGLGTRYGSGCTSGHGVCGVSRLSPRSLVATLAFMAAGFATVFATHHIFS
jgi:uncharacterized membrane protein YedE/YeeE